MTGMKTAKRTGMTAPKAKLMHKVRGVKAKHPKKPNKKA